MADRYFVRANDGAPEKGPFAIDLIKKSHERRMLKDNAICRLENGTETFPLSTLLELPTPGEPRRTSTSAFSQGEMDAMVRRQKSEGSANMTIGLAMIVVGLVLTAVSFSASGGGGVVFIGLVVFGFVRIIRGASGG